MATIHHQIAIRASRTRVYEALAEADAIGTWWDKQTPVETADGLVLEHNPGPKHGPVRLKVLSHVPGQRVEWECVSRHPSESPASAWTGTHFVFEISEDESAAATAERESDGGKGSFTTVDFNQTGYDEKSKFAGFNNHAWGQVLNNLKRVCEGKKS